MGTRDPRVDAYIERAPAFAQSVLRHLRELVHEACPDVVETIKWGMPSFGYHGILCGMAAFKEHCTFGFWHPLMRERSEEHTSELQSRPHLVCRLLLEKKKRYSQHNFPHSLSTT